MKNLLIICWAVLCAVACTKSDTTDPDPGEKTPEIHIQTPEIVMPEVTQGSTTTKTAEFTSSVPWTLSLSNTKSIPTWFEVYPTSGGAGKSTITITIKEANPFYEDRSAFIILDTDGIRNYITVSQKKKEAILVSKDRYEFTSKAEEFSVEVKSNVTYQVVIPEDFKDWLKHKNNNTKAGGLTTSVENFEVTEGSDSGNRDGFIVFKSGELADTVRVFQAKKSVLTLTQSQLNVSYLGNDALEVEVRSNLKYEIKIPSNIKSWVSVIEPIGRSVRVDRFYLKVEKNGSYENRIGEIIIKDVDSDLSSKLTIQQSQENAIILSNRNAEVGSSGGILDVEIQSNIAYQVKILGEDTPGWIKQLPTSRALQKENVKFSIDPIVGTSSRQGKIVFMNSDTKIADTLIVNQSGIEKKLYLGQKIIHFNSGGYGVNVPIYKNSEEISVQVIIPDSLKWVTFAPQAPIIEINIEHHALHIGENQGYKPRSGVVIFKDKNSSLADTLLIKQKAKENIIIGQREYHVSSNDTIINVAINPNIDYDFYLPNNPTWIKQIDYIKGLSDRNLSFRIEKNTTQTARSNQIIFRNKQSSDTEYINITQKAYRENGVYQMVAGSSLLSVIDRQAKRDTITYMKVKGQMLDSDFAVFQTNANNLPKLTVLDLSDVTMVSNTIPGNTFMDNSSLRRIILPKGITEIAAFSFHKCVSLKDKIVIPNGVTVLREGAFQYCEKLEGVDLNNVRNLGNNVFAHCYKLADINLEKLESIGIMTFAACRSLRGELIIPPKMTVIPGSAFSGCEGLTKVDFNNVKDIYSGAFAYCWNLTDIHLRNVENIGLIPSEGMNWGDSGNSFENCSGLTKLDLRSTKFIGKACFLGCRNLTEINLREVEKIGSYAFGRCENLAGKLHIPSSITNIGEFAFNGCVSLTSIVMDGNAEVGNNAFWNCIKLTDITLNKVKSFGSNVFQYCKALKGQLIFPNTLISIGNYAFDGMSFTGNLLIPSSVQFIGDRAFRNCKGLTGEVVLPKNIQSLGSNCFLGMSIQSVKFLGNNPPSHGYNPPGPSNTDENKSGPGWIVYPKVIVYIPKDYAKNYRKKGLYGWGYEFYEINGQSVFYNDCYYNYQEY